MQSSHSISSFHKSRGFTLIEVLITVVIIALLAGFAMMNYQRYVVRANRVAATGCMMSAAQYMERFYTVNMRYDQSRTGDAPVLPIAECANDVSGSYVISLASSTATAYSITAVPQGRQAAKDTECGTIGINARGQKTITGTSTTAKCF